MTASFFVEVTLGAKTYKARVSSSDCTYVYDFKCAVKNEFSPLLNSYAAAQLTLLRPGGTAKIDAGEDIGKLQMFPVGPRAPLVVTVEELPIRARTGDSQHRNIHRGVTAETSCRRYLNAIAYKIFASYNIENVYTRPTMDDILAAKDGREGVTWEYRLCLGHQLTNIPLPEFFSQAEWEVLKSLNASTTKQIHEADLALTNSREPFIIIPHSEFASEYIDVLRRIATIADIVSTEDELVVLDESSLPRCAS